MNPTFGGVNRRNMHTHSKLSTDPSLPLGRFQESLQSVEVDYSAVVGIPLQVAASWGFDGGQKVGFHRSDCAHPHMYLKSTMAQFQHPLEVFR
jgi:hypothetical protein